MGRVRGKDTSGDKEEARTHRNEGGGGGNWVGQKSLHQRDVKKVNG